MSPPHLIRLQHITHISKNRHAYVHAFSTKNANHIFNIMTHPALLPAMINNTDAPHTPSELLHVHYLPKRQTEIYIETGSYGL